MNIEKIIRNQKLLLKDISNNYHIELTYDHAFLILNALTQQAKTIESLKCCANCCYGIIGKNESGNYNRCYECKHGVPFDNIQPKEKDNWNRIK